MTTTMRKTKISKATANWKSKINNRYIKSILKKILAKKIIVGKVVITYIGMINKTNIRICSSLIHKRHLLAKT